MTSVIDNQREHGAADPHTLNRQQKYDLIGQYNMQIVKIEHNIPSLESTLAGMPDDFHGNREAIQQSLHENRMELVSLKAKVRYLYSVLHEEFSRDLEKISEALARMQHGAEINRLEGHRHDVEQEIARIEKILASI